MPTTFFSPADERAPPPRSRAPAMARLLIALLARLDRGRVELRAPDVGVRRFGPGGEAAPGVDAATLEVMNWRMAAKTLKGGDVGFGESYMAGDWSTPDLFALLTILAANQASLERAFYGRAWTRGLLRLRHWMRANTRRRAKKNIAAHYDLGNDFYALWLDRTMTYSSAIFDGDASRTLEEAQQAKYDRLLSELDLAQGAHVLEIGCGWGGFAETAARAGHRVTGISLSARQTGWARERLARAGLADRAELRLQDYRDVRGTFDGVASIEMIEAVGEAYWPSYFGAVRDLLRPGGRACIQAITIADERFDRYRTQSDFIQQYVFPGGMLLSPSRIVAEAGRAGLRLVRERRFGADYATTLRRWLAAFDASAETITAQFGIAFVRCWRFYLAYCAAGFATGTTDVGQYTFERAAASD
jgi:cyclopropane-fatty-acyl-phospholipid synthase